MCITGKLEIGDNSFYPILAGAVTLSSFIRGVDGPNSFGAAIEYTDTGSEVWFFWIFQLSDVVPTGVKILYVDGYYSIGSTGIAPASGADEVTIAYRDNINSPIISTTPSSWDTAHASIAVNIAVTPITGGFITLKGKVKDPSDWSGSFNVIIVTYVW